MRKNNISSGRIPRVRLMSEMTEEEDNILAARADRAMQRSTSKVKKGGKK